MKNVFKRKREMSVCSAILLCMPLLWQPENALAEALPISAVGGVNML